MYLWAITAYYQVKKLGSTLKKYHEKGNTAAKTSRIIQRRILPLNVSIDT